MMPKSRRGRHTSAKGLKNIIKLLEKQAWAKKIILGPFYNCRHKYGPKTLRKINDENGTITYRAYTGDGYRKIFVICRK